MHAGPRNRVRRHDYCRRVGGGAGNARISCTHSTGSGFADGTTTAPLDWGEAPDTAFVDATGDRRDDYCRLSASRALCTVSGGTAFGATIASGLLDPGAETGRAWADFDGDGDRDFCRPVGASVTTAQVFCTLWPGLSHTVPSSPVDLGYATERAWVDHNGDGKADYCRRVGDAPNNMVVSCTVSNGSGFGPLPRPGPQPAPTPAPTPQADPPRPAPQLKRILIVVSFGRSATSRSTRFAYLRVKGVPRGATVTARCPKGCSRKLFTKRNARGTISLKSLIRKRLKVGTTITVTVTRPNEIGAVKVLKVRPSRDPSITTRCLAPGAKRPSAC